MPTGNGEAAGFSIVIPAFNEAGRIASSLRTILDYLAANDLDGDGIDDNLQTDKSGKQLIKGNMTKSGTSLDNESKQQKRKGAKNQHGKD